VNAQMEVLSGGYFAGEVDNLEQPICFRLHGYAPLDVELKGRSGDIVDLGTLHMSPMPAAKLANLMGRLALDGQESASKASIRLSIEYGPINTPNLSISSRKHWAQPIRAKIGEDGRISASGFSPLPYKCTVEVPGYVMKTFIVSFKEGETYDLGTVSLEKPKPIELTYIVAEKPPFDATKKKNTIIVGGDKWKATPDIYGWDLEFIQDQGEIFCNYTYGPCHFKDLGSGDMIDYLDSTIDTDLKDGPIKEKVQSGHVYLVDQRFWKRWILVRVSLK